MVSPRPRRPVTYSNSNASSASRPTGPRASTGRRQAAPSSNSPTHFLSFPLHHGHARIQTRGSLSHFSSRYEAVLPPRSVRPPGTVHFTLGALRLPNAQAVNDAAQTLREVVSTYHDRDSGNAPIELKGLHPLPVPSQGQTKRGLKGRARVLYTAAHPSSQAERLVRFGEVVRAAYSNTLVQHGGSKTRKELLLHATLVNTVYSPRSHRQRPTIPYTYTCEHGPDSEVETAAHQQDKHDEELEVDLDEWRDYVWASNVNVSRVSLCQMGAVMANTTSSSGEGIENDQEYREIASVDITDCFSRADGSALV